MEKETKKVVKEEATRVSKKDVKSETKKKDQFKNVNYCGLPPVPERKLDQDLAPDRLSLIRYHEKKWVNETTLRYHFMDDPISWKGEDDQKDAVRKALQTWKDLGIGLKFIEVGNPRSAEIRIGFEPGGSWSYVGRDCIDLVPDPTKLTMNFGWSLTTPYGRDTALHEIGHALGFPHEHQNPQTGIEWNEREVYQYFKGSPNFWNRQKIQYNIIRKIASQDVGGSSWDRDSIMHYSFKAGLIVKPTEYQGRDLIPKPGLSNIDKSEALKFYPKPDATKELELIPFKSVPIEIKPTEQKNFIINPPETRNYAMSTFGEWDTVMVLFEDLNGEPQYVAGNDDSGSDLNSRISTRLLQGRKYYLRVRLYHSDGSGEGCVMLW